MCAFYAHWKVDALEKEFGGRFREHLFRYNSLVPEAIRLDLSHEEGSGKGAGGGPNVPEYYLRQSHAKWASSSAKPIVLSEESASVSATAFAKQLESESAPVIRFTTLYGVSVALEPADESVFEATWKRALVAGTVRQYD